jgi:AraC-like DNA-binding protein
MIAGLICLIAATAGFLSTVLIIITKKQDGQSLINKYLIIILSIASMRLLLHGCSQLYPISGLIRVTKILDILGIITLPCYLLYFQDIVFESKFQSKNTLHFITPVVILIVYMGVFFNSGTVAGIFLILFFTTSYLFFLLYIYWMYQFLAKKVWNRKSDINAVQKQNDIIKNWTILLYVCFILMLLSRFITGTTLDTPGVFNNRYFWLSALIWMCIFVKIILTPEIVYGYNFLNKTIKETTKKLVLSSIWQLGSPVQPIVSGKDKKLEEKIAPLLVEYVHKIEELSFHSPAFRQQELSTDDMATALQIPSSHVNYILKYHCKEGFTDYKKIVRIHDATQLLDSGYLNESTIESLATLVGFSSYHTFYVAFKSITGVTTQEYVRRL